MNFVEILLLSVALAMDCFTVSIVSGVILQKKEWGVILSMSTLFGVFQALMPLLGWLGTTSFAKYFENYDHWVAFALLSFIGGKMIRESFMPEEQQTFNPRHLHTQLLLAVATSIDALAIGISFAVTGYDTLSQLCLPLVTIGVASLVFGIAGHLLGISFGRSVSQRLKPGLLGGVILVLIGLKVLLSHLFGF